MIASENVVSPLARSLLDSDFNHRYAEGDIGAREYQGSRFIDELETIVVDLAKQLFGSVHVEHRAISGALANMAVYYGLGKPGQKVCTLRVPEGAHISFREFGTAGARGLEVLNIPFDKDRMNIDVDAFTTLIEKERPHIVTLGGSLFLFPHPVKEVRKACDVVGTRLHYDGAHVLGLIAGKRFQDPLREGAHVVTGSTHKTFPGPQGALMLSNEDRIHHKLSKAIFPGLVSNHHLGRMAPLAVTLAEMIEFGEDYAAQIVRNAKVLAKTLDDAGLEVLARDHGYTESHQVVLDVVKEGGGKEVAVRLERAGIIANKNLLPCDEVSCVHDPAGIRLGVQELTRFGMKEAEMGIVGAWIAGIITKQRDEASVAEEIKRFLKDFNIPKYCYDLN